MNNTWSRFYDNEYNVEFLISHINNHAILINAVVNKNPKRILEVGIGTGTMSIFLSYLGYDIVGIDNNKMVLERAMALNEKLNGNAKFMYADALKLDSYFSDKFDVVFSQGFFEHFDNETINELIKQQLNVGNTIIFSVPSRFYPRKDFGNERLLKIEEWKKIMMDFNISDAFYYGYRIPIPIAKQFPAISKPRHIYLEVK